MIILHARDLTIDTANITHIEYKTENQTAHTTTVSTLPEKQLLFISIDEALQRNKRYVLDISFRGVINNLAVGLYRSSYQARGRNER